MAKKAKLPQRVSYSFNLLTTRKGRQDLLGSILPVIRGTAQKAAVKTALAVDEEKRPYRKPVVAQNRRYESVSAAARDIRIRNYPHLSTSDAIDQERRLRVNIARWCHADNVEGYYWSE